MNRISFSFPNLLVLNKYAGAAIGVDYERYLLRSGMLSIDAGARLLNAGTVTIYGGKTGSRRHNEKGYAFSGAAIFHPLGNRRRVDPGIGGGLLAGNMRITDRVLNTPAATQVRELPLTVLFGQIGMNVNNPGAFSFGVELRGGPILSGARSGAAYVEFGLKIGTQF